MNAPAPPGLPELLTQRSALRAKLADIRHRRDLVAALTRAPSEAGRTLANIRAIDREAVREWLAKGGKGPPPQPSAKEISLAKEALCLAEESAASAKAASDALEVESREIGGLLIKNQQAREAAAAADFAAEFVAEGERRKELSRQLDEVMEHLRSARDWLAERRPALGQAYLAAVKALPESDFTGASPENIRLFAANFAAKAAGGDVAELDTDDEMPPPIAAYRILPNGDAEKRMMYWREYREERRIHPGRWSATPPEGRAIRDYAEQSEAAE